MTDHNFTKHERLNVKGQPDVELIRYNARRYQLNQISCLELMELETESSLLRWQAINNVMGRLYRIHTGIAVSMPHWSSLITLKGMEFLTNENSD